MLLRETHRTSHLFELISIEIVKCFDYSSKKIEENRRNHVGSLTWEKVFRFGGTFPEVRFDSSKLLNFIFA